MKLSISAQAIHPQKDEYLFRSGSFSALKMLNEHDFKLMVSDGQLSDEQSNLLKQEGVRFSDFKDPDFLISLNKDQTITIFDSDEEVFSSSEWNEVLSQLISPSRKATLSRTTNETDIKIDLDLNGTGKSDISTGLNFFDHMLDQIAKHGLIDLSITCDGDLEVDEHHTIEDVALALGETISSALGEKKGIERYGFILPMDEAQATVALDLSGRPYLVFDVPVTREYVGDFPTEMLEHFFYSLAMNLKATIHVSCTGNNDHHKIEACFKGFARALKTAIEQNGRIKNQIPSSKGSL